MECECGTSRLYSFLHCSVVLRNILCPPTRSRQLCPWALSNPRWSIWFCSIQVSCNQYAQPWMSDHLCGLHRGPLLLACCMICFFVVPRGSNLRHMQTIKTNKQHSFLSSCHMQNGITLMTAFLYSLVILICRLHFILKCDHARPGNRNMHGWRM